MKKVLLSMLVAGSMVCFADGDAPKAEGKAEGGAPVASQERGHRPPRMGERGQMMRPGMQNALGVTRMLESPFVLKKLGLKDDEIKAVQEKMKPLNEKNRKISEELAEISQKQAKVAKNVLAEKGKDIKKLMNITEKIGNLNTERSKLMVERLAVIRDSLTDEQLANAVKMINEMPKPGEMMRRGARNSEGGKPAVRDGGPRPNGGDREGGMRRRGKGDRGGQMPAEKADDK